MGEAATGAAGPGQADRSPGARGRLAVAAAGVGSSAAQVLVIRELLVVSAGNELSIAAVLAWWLLWSGVGSWIGGRVVSASGRSPTFHVGAIALVEVAVVAGALAFSRAGLYWLRGLFGGALIGAGLVPPLGGTLSLPQVLLFATLVTAPAGIVLGWQFAAGCHLLAGEPGARQGATRAYVFDSLGHLAGGAVLSITAVTRLPAEGVLLAACLVVLLGVWLLRPLAWRIAVGAAVVAALALGVPRYREATLALRWAPYHLAVSRDGPIGNVSVIEGEGGELAFFENGAHAFETGEALAGEQWVHMALLAHPSPQRILLVGGGPRALREVLKHDPEHVSYFELDPTLISAIRRCAPPELRQIIANPAVTVSPADARLRLGRMQREGAAFDVVLVALPDPTTAQLNRYYTLEWFRGVQHVLAPGGLAAFQVMSSGDYLSPELRSYNACLFHTVLKAGLRAAIFPGEHMTVLCSAGEEPGQVFDEAMGLAARMEARGLDSATILASFYDALDPFRREDRLRDLAQTTDVRLNRDFAPTCYYYAQVLWASWWGGKTAGVLKAASRLSVGPLLLGVVAATVLAAAIGRCVRRPMKLTAPYAVFVAGASGMTLEVVLLIGLQSLYGYVYGVVGFAIGVLMAGLAAGAWLASRCRGVRSARTALAGAQGGIAVAAGLSAGGLFALARLCDVQGAAGLLAVPAIAVLMGVTGVAVGAAFPAALAAVSESETSVRAGTALYATDLVGACAGALIAGLVLIPLLGVAATCGTVAALAACAALLTVATPIKGEAL
jgi:spermidine synthase